MNRKEKATLGGGCFWCLEAVYSEMKGIVEILSGYAGGSTLNPTYESVCSGQTGHAEVVQLTFEPRVVSYAKILDVFFSIHDPTTLNRQGADVGTQYRSVIFYHSPEQRAIAERLIAQLTEDQIWPDPIVTSVEPAPIFFPAELYHRSYYRRNQNSRYCESVIEPKVNRFRENYSLNLKE